MKKTISLLLYVLVFHFVICQSLIFSQEVKTDQPLTQEELSNNTEKLIEDLRKSLDTSTYKEAFNSIYKAMKNNTVDKTWFLYIMLAEVGQLSGNFGTVIRFVPNKGNLRVFKKALEIWSTTDIITAAKLMATIAHINPSINYLVGKLYLSQGRLYEGAGYLMLGSQMRDAPYGLYYAGVGQNAVGNFSKAYSFLDKAKEMLLGTEEEIKLDIQTQMAVSQFGNNNYSKAYDLIMPVYEKRPIETLKKLDPGLILTALKKNDEARDFWNKALKLKLPYTLSQQIKKNLNYNKRLVDPNYPPAWMRR